MTLAEHARDKAATYPFLHHFLHKVAETRQDGRNAVQRKTPPMSLTFTVYGAAVPQGSAKAFTPKGWTRPIITSDNRNLKDWRHLIADAAGQALRASATPFNASGATQIVAAFYLPRPKSLPKTKEKPHVTKPDVDKLARALLDAITGVLLNDDSQVTQLKVTKAYAALGEAPHVTVVVTPL